MLQIVPGARLYRGFLDPAAQDRLAREIEVVVARAPLFTPKMPRTGKEFSVRMTNCGPLGWVSDQERGYRYQPTHPVTGEPWPAMPETLFRIWERLADYPFPPEACLVNYYGPKAQMGLHQDRDEADLAAPIISVSLGAACRFRLGGTRRTDSTLTFALTSGDVLVLGGPARLCFHGVDRILREPSAGSEAPLLAGGGRINLTLRRVS